jgi:catechol 2,3-dioxygenase-like lactoylglutathione lyase family enzyme
MDARLSFVTLGVENLERSVRFYRDVLRFPQIPLPDGADVAFFELGKTWLSLYPRASLAADAGLSAEGRGFPGFTLAHNVRAQPEVDQLLAEIAAGGGRIVRPAREAEWGGYSGYFADPDGFLWEVAWNPQFPHA